MAKKMAFVIVLVLGLILCPMASSGASESQVTYRAGSMVSVSAPQTSIVELGSLTITFDPLSEGDHVVLVSLPDNFGVVAPGTMWSVEDPWVSMTTSISGQPNEFRLHINYSGQVKKLTFQVPIKTSIPSGATGDIPIRLKNLQGHFPDGEVIVGRISSKGQVTVTISPAGVKIIEPDTELPFSVYVGEDKGDVLRSGTGTLELVLPHGFAWEQVEVKILSDGGYLPVARINTSDGRVLEVDIQERGSRTKGAFQVSGRLKASRTLLPGSDVRVEVRGVDLLKPESLVLVRVIEPEIEARFIVGSNAYFYNEHVLTMDVTPYLKGGRVFLPLRYVGLSLGVDSDNIRWDGRTATLIGQGQRIQVRPGEGHITVNGTEVSMDTAAEFRQGRIMLPYRYIAEAFGATIGWHATTGTVTMEL